MRGKQAPKRKIAADPKFGSQSVAKLINHIMYGGKKLTAQTVVYDAFDIVQEKMQKPGIEIFDEALKNVAPSVEVKSRRVGGANYQVPLQVRNERRLLLALRWMIDAARSRKGRPMAERLATEIMDAAQNQGEAVKKRNDVHRMAEANRAFAHFAR